MKTLATFFTLLLLICNLHAKPPEQNIIEKELISVIRAPYTGDKELLLKHTHKKVLELAGGRENFEKVMEYLEQTLRGAGVTYDSAKIGKPYSYHATKTEEIFMVDVSLTLKKGNEKHVAEITQVAVKGTDSKNWKYIDTSRLNDELLKKWFPNLPESFSLEKAK